MKNVVFILTDQQHFRTIRANGCAEADTPHLDRLASEGLNFQNHFVANPVCSPSRGAIWTGRYPSKNGLYANGCTLPDSETTLPMVLREHGMETAHFGKLHLEPTMTQGIRPGRFGFETCEIGEGDQFLTHDDYNLWLRQKDPKAFFDFYHQMAEEGHAKAYVSNLPEHLTHTHWVTHRGIEWMQNERDPAKPFFLSLGYFDPHHAWNPCEPYASRWACRGISKPVTSPDDLPGKPSHWGGGHGLDPFELSSIIRSYHAMISQIDASVGRLIAAIELSGELENTVIVFSSDHGEFLGNHGKLFKGPFLCDDLLRVPLIVWYGAKPRGGKTISDLTSSLDLFSTIAALNGIATLSSDGERFLDAELNLHPDGQRDHVISEWRMHPFDVGSNSDILSIRTKNERYVRYANTGEEEYYTHAIDQSELNNRSGESSNHKRRRQLAALLNAYAPEPGTWGPPTSPW